VVRAALALSLIAVAIPAAAAPGAFQLSGTATCLSDAPAVFLHWTPSSGATSYDVIRDDGRRSTVVSTTAYDTNVVTGGPAHTYLIRASDGGPVTTDSNSVTVAPPAAPCPPAPPEPVITGFAYCDPGNPQRSMQPAVQVQWRRTFSATSYDVYLNGFFYYTFNSGAGLPGMNTLAVINDTLAGQKVTFYVIAKNAGAASISNTIELTVPADICTATPPVPVLSGGAVCDNSRVPVVQLDWTAVTGAFGYQLFRNGVPYAISGYITYSDTNVVPGQTYTYNVATTGLSAPLSNTITVTVPEGGCPPGPLVVTPGLICNDNRSGVRLTWTASTNAASYTIVRDSTALSSGISANAHTYDDMSAVPGATYAYRVLGVNGSVSTASAPVTVTASDEVCPPFYFTLSAAATCPHSAPSVHLTWSPSVHATSYTVSREGTVVSGKLPATAREYTDSPGLAPTSYSAAYSVVSANASGKQIATANVSILRVDCGLAPGAFNAYATGYCNQGAPAVRITWFPPADGASYYMIVRNGITVASAYLSYSDTNVVPNQSYTYTVLAVNAYGNATALAGPITPSLGDCPPTVFTLNAATGCNQPVTLFWTAATNSPLSYSIIRDHFPIASVASNVLTYADYSAQPNASYTYFVREDGSGGSSDSNVVTVHLDQTCGAVPDLTALGIRPSAMSGRVGDTIAVNVELANLGNGTSTVATARVRLGRGPSMSSSDLELGTISLPAIVSGGDIARTMNVTLPAVPAGTYYLFLSLDEEHVSGEVHFGDDVKASGAFSLTDMIPPKRRAATH